MTLHTASPLTVRTLGAADLPAIQSLFKQVFGHELSDSFYAWKYRSGHSGAIGVFRDDKLIAHYGGVGADIVMQGVPERALQVVDVMVSTEARHHARAQSPFFLAASTFLQHYVGYQQPYLLGYGFPNVRTMRLAEHLRLYAAVGGISELTMPLGPPPRLTDSRWKWCELTADNLPRYAAVIDGLGRELQHSLPDAILVRRDAARIAYRYLQHPQQQYHLWLLQSRVLGRSKALVVLKREAARVLLMDVLAPLELIPEVLHVTAVAVHGQFALPLVAWFSSSQVDSVAPPGATVQALPISTPANIWSNSPAPAELQDRWWLTAGDTDFL